MDVAVTPEVVETQCMATIHKEIIIRAPVHAAWDAIRDVGAVHRRLAPGILLDATLDGDARVVTFANGLVARELIVTIDDEARRFAYASVGGRATHHNASMQVFPHGEGTRFVWITDVLPEEIAESIRSLVEQGSEIIRRTLERTPAAA
jgi:carbon monoxide dehydrogenase subunit G